jgi:hypothetical protein
MRNFVPTSAAIVAAERRGMVAGKQFTAVSLHQYCGLARAMRVVLEAIFGHGRRNVFEKFVYVM